MIVVMAVTVAVAVYVLLVIILFGVEKFLPVANNTSSKFIFSIIVLQTC